MSSGAAQQLPFREDLVHFECWALSALRCELESTSENSWKVTLPKSLQADWNGKRELYFQAPANGKSHAKEDEESTIKNGVDTLRISPVSQLFQWTVNRLQTESPVHAAPRSQPAGVHAITPTLFGQFTFDQGHIHLAGCSFESRPIVRVTNRFKEEESAATLSHRFLWPNGAGVNDELVSQLGVEQLEPVEERLRQKVLAEVNSEVEKLTTTIGEQESDIVAVTVIWCKYAEGKIAFEAGDETIHVPFSGWAQLLAQGLSTEPYDCPLTGVKTYNLTLTDDGRIAAAEGVAACEESGKHFLLSEIGRCSATGKRVEKKLLETCRTSGERVLATLLAGCSQCGQSVSPNSLKGGRCSACRSLTPIRKDDPRMARLLDEYPKLDQWPRWRVAETESVYVLLATSWLRQLSMVVDKESLEVSHVATSGRLLTNWVEATDSQREEWLES